MSLGAASAPAFRPADVRSFRYTGWDLDTHTGLVSCTYALDDLPFVEEFVFPHLAGAGPSGALLRALRLLHLAAGVSYYKAAVPGVVEGVPPDTVAWLADLYLHGLMELVYRHGLEPVRPLFRTSGATPVAEMGGGPSGPLRAPGATAFGKRPRALVAVGGGKDSIVTIESLGAVGIRPLLASVNTHPAIDATAAVSGLEHAVVHRRVDPAIVALNGRGAINGHVPVTAINGLALAALAVGLGIPTVVMSIESSASVPIAEHRGVPVNHQYSKSFAFEQSLDRLLRTAVDPGLHWFSLLRPLHEVEICRRFAGLRAYFGVVTSCNQAYTAAGRRAGVRWCGTCPKCLFVFLGLAPFLDPHDLVGIMGADLLRDPALVDGFAALVGRGAEVPLECIGTVRENAWAMRRLAADTRWQDAAVVRSLAPLLGDDPGFDPLVERGLHAIPPDFAEAADALA